MGVIRPARAPKPNVNPATPELEEPRQIPTPAQATPAQAAEMVDQMEGFEIGGGVGREYWGDEELNGVLFSPRKNNGG